MRTTQQRTAELMAPWRPRQGLAADILAANRPLEVGEEATDRAALEVLCQRVSHQLTQTAELIRAELEQEERARALLEAGAEEADGCARVLAAHSGRGAAYVAVSLHDGDVRFEFAGFEDNIGIDGNRRVPARQAAENLCQRPTPRIEQMSEPGVVSGR